MTHNKKKP